MKNLLSISMQVARIGLPKGFRKTSQQSGVVCPAHFEIQIVFIILNIAAGFCRKEQDSWSLPATDVT